MLADVPALHAMVPEGVAETVLPLELPQTPSTFAAQLLPFRVYPVLHLNLHSVVLGVAL
jgi:hypothetical protein